MDRNVSEVLMHDVVRTGKQVTVPTKASDLTDPSYGMWMAWKSDEQDSHTD
jgi:hypothetical protein